MYICQMYRQYGDDFETVVQFLEQGADIPIVTVNYATDVRARIWSPTTGVTIPAGVTWTQCNSAVMPGHYYFKFRGSSFNDGERFQILSITHNPGGACAPFIPLCINVINVERYWPEFNKDFDNLHGRVDSMADLQGAP